MGVPMVSGSLTILVVEDDGNSRESLAAALSDCGYTVVTAASGNAAIGMLVGAKVDVIVTDLMMDDGDGLSLVNHVRANGVPVIVVSACAGSEQAALAKAHGAFACLPKPIDLNRLEEALVAATGRTAQ